MAEDRYKRRDMVYLREGGRPLARGQNDTRHPLLLMPGESPDLLNIDLDRDSIRPTGGASKFNNQTAPRPGLMVGTAARSSKLGVLPGKSVPMRGYAYLPYDEAQDLGGDDASAVYGPASDPYDVFWHTRRGKDFELQLSFRIPESEKLFAAETRGQLTSISAASTWDMRFGAGQELDEFSAILQKGGDRFTPMSWAIGIVNTGSLFDTDVGGGNNIFGVPITTYANRKSNYALCFMWLDSPQANVIRPVHMRYDLAGGNINATETGSAEYCSLAYRSFIIPQFVEPGENYTSSLRLSLDTGTVGTTAQPGIDGDAPAFNDDSIVEWYVSEGMDNTPTRYAYEEGSPGATIFRYKGPADSLEYFGKYGIRYHGRDAMFLGLGYRYAAWSSAGSIPFGIDSCPVENGGFGIADQSVQGPTVSTLYAELTDPEKEEGAGNGKTNTYDLQIAHDPAKDLTGTLFEVKEVGLVNRTASAGHDWGNETGVWAAIGPQGKLPWAPYDQPWSGLGGLLTTGFNPEALKSYRLIFSVESSGQGFATQSAAGAMISIGRYDNGNAYTGPAYAQFITAEGGDQFLGTPPSFGPAAPYTLQGQWFVTVRAFRWNQRPVVVDDVRIFTQVRSTAGTNEQLFNFAMTHEVDPDDTNELGIQYLVGHWRLNDGGGTVLHESVLGNHGVLAPMSTAVMPGGRKGNNALFLSGEGEALTLDFEENPDFAEQVRAALDDGESGCAIQFTVRIPEACYGMTQRVDEWGVPGFNVFRTKFAPPLAVWDFNAPDRASDLGGSPATTTVDDVGGYYTRPTPLLEFGHNVEVESVVGVKASLYPAGFSLKVPTNHDQRNLRAGVIGTGATGMHSWQGLATPRWDTDARWVGREVTFVFGLHPTGNDDEYSAYLQAWPKEYLNPAANEGASAEFGYHSVLDPTSGPGIYNRTQIMRSRIVIGGAWDPQQDGEYDAGWQTKGRAVMEANARIILEDAQVFAVSTPGALPGTNGGIVPAGTGKIVGRNAPPQRELSADDLLLPIDRSDSGLDVTDGSFTAEISGGGFFHAAEAWESVEAIKHTMLTVLGDETHVPAERTFGRKWLRSYFVRSATGTALTLNRPYVGVTRKGAAARSFRHGAYTAFSDDISDRVLTLGKGDGYDLVTVTTQDAHITPEFFVNLAPTDISWRFRVYSPLAAGRVADLLPSWVRGVQRSRANPIRGLHSHNETLYVGAQGSLFEGDDRWRLTGPHDGLTRSLAFRGDELVETRLLHPKHRDWAEFPSATQVDLTATLLEEAAATKLALFDAWVYLDGYGELQSIAQCVRPDRDPSLAAVVQWWTRLADGYPELAVGTSGVSGGSLPDKGLLSARGSVRVPLKTWTHVRWMLFEDAVGGDVQNPVCWINGKLCAVALSGTDDAAASGWIPYANLVPVSSAFRVLLGAAHDRVVQPFVTRTVTAEQDLSDDPITPELVTGRLHSLNGRLAGVAVGRSVVGTAGFDSTVNFHPEAIDYSLLPAAADQRLVSLQDAASDGVSHKLLDGGIVPQWGVIHSSPFVSLFHTAGREDEPWSFENYEDRTFAANGGRPVVIRHGSARFAGLLPPATLPDVEARRTPVWEENYFVGAGDPDNDPIWKANTARLDEDFTDPNADEKVFHYRNPGTGYALSSSASAMAWLVDTYFAFKCYFRLNQVTGRVPIYYQRSSLANGGTFIEVRDGYVHAGWYDTDQKREVFVRLSEAIVEPGKTYYLYYRKFYPRGGLTTPNAFYYRAGSNWADTLPNNSGTAAVNESCYDSLIVREIPREAPAASGALGAFHDWKPWHLKSFVNSPPNGAVNYDYTAAGSETRACLSFVPADQDFGVNPYTLTRPYSGTGYVMFDVDVDAAASGGGGGTEIAIDGATEVLRFTLDHVGMYLQVAGPILNGFVYRITEFVSATVVRAVNQAGSGPGWSPATLAATKMSVFSGVSLIKSEGYDDSVSPDNAHYAVEVAGSSLVANPLNGVAPFDGRLWSVAYGIFSATGGVDGGGNRVRLPDIFEDASVAHATGPERIAHGGAIGCDNFGLQGTHDSAGFANPLDGSLPKDGIPCGELEVDSGFAHTCWDTAAYFPINFGVGATVASSVAPGSTQPNATRSLTLDPTASGAVVPVWSLITTAIAGTRVVRITFRDDTVLDQSYVSEELTVDVPLEDENNPSASVSLVFTRMPAPPDGRAAVTTLYMSQVGSTDLYRRVDVPNREVDTVVVPIDDLNDALGVALDFTVLGAPPKCRYLRASQGRMSYANNPLQNDGVFYSVGLFPEQVPPTNIFPIDTGDAAITGLHDMLSTLVVFKATSISFWLFDPNTGAPTLVRTIRGVGCVSNQSITDLEDWVYFMSRRGPMVLTRDGSVSFIGKRMQSFLDDKLYRPGLADVSATIDERRNQVIFTLRSNEDSGPGRRFGIEYEHSRGGEDALDQIQHGHRFSTFLEPQCTALGNVEPDDSGHSLVVGGTKHGFLVWLNRSDTRMVMSGPEHVAGSDYLFGKHSLTLASATDAQVDLELEGQMGAVVRWYSSGEQEAELLFTVAGSPPVLWVGSPARPLSALTPAAIVSLGAQLHRWRTRTYDGANPAQEKKATWLDVTRVPQAAGVLKVDVFKDLDTAPRDTIDLQLTQDYFSHELGSILQECRSFSFLLRTESPAADLDFEILDLLARYTDTTLRGN